MPKDDDKKKDVPENADDVVKSETPETPAVEPTPPAEPAAPAAAPTPAPALVSKWDSVVGPFAKVIAKPVVEIATALKELVGEPSDSAAELLQNVEDTPDADIKDALKDLGVPRAVLGKAIKSLRKAPKPVTADDAASAMNLSLGILPDVPDDESFLQALRTGGELKVDRTTVISAVRSALAKSCNLYDIPAELVRRMEAFAEDMEEAVSPDFFKLRKLLTRRSYAEIFAAIDGLEGSFVTEARKKTFLARLDENLWPSVLSFHEQLKAWMETWQQTAGNPAAIFGAIAGMVGGGGVAMPAGMMAPPPTDNLKDAALGVNDDINKLFAGVGIPVARALAYDAQTIKGVLTDPGLPMQIGAPNREQMLKMLKVNVSADYVRLEQNVTKYLLGIMGYNDVTSEIDLQYLSALFMLGNAIPWETIRNLPSRGGRGGRHGDDAHRI